MRRKKEFSNSLLPDLDEDNVPSSAVTVDQPVLESLIALLTTLLSGKEPSNELLSEAVVKTLHESQNKRQSRSKESILTGATSDSKGATPSKELFTNKQVLTTQLFQTIREKSVDFIVMSRSSEKVVYGDPSDPQNPEKQIEYRWNPQTNAWKIIPGPKVNALIPDEKNKQLVTINAGKAQYYGTGKTFEIETMTLNKSKHDSIDSRLLQGSKQLINQKMGTHRLYTFSVPEGKQGDLQHYAQQFANERCERGRSTLLGDIIRTFQLNEHPEILETLCYTDKAGNWYVWKELCGDGKLGLKYKPDGTIDVLLPEKYTGGEHLVFLGHKDVGESGFAGGQLLYLKRDGSVGYAANSNYETPKLSDNVERISKQEMEQYLENARQSAKAFLEGRQFIAEIVQPGIRTTERKEIVFPGDAKEVVGRVTARLEEQRTTKPTRGLPDNIKVTGLDGAPVFEMHCPPFKEPGCLDEDFERYEATVYVLKKVGSKIDKDKSNALILEVRNNGEVRLRSGTCGDTAVKAKISIQHKGKEFIAFLHDDATQTYEKDAVDSPFRESANPTFMCVRGCCGHYTEDNKRLMENPALAKEVTM